MSGVKRLAAKDLKGKKQPTNEEIKAKSKGKGK